MVRIWVSKIVIGEYIKRNTFELQWNSVYIFLEKLQEHKYRIEKENEITFRYYEFLEYDISSINAGSTSNLNLR